MLDTGPVDNYTIHRGITSRQISEGVVTSPPLSHHVKALLGVSQYEAPLCKFGVK